MVNDSWVDVGALSDFAEGTPRAVEIGNDVVAVVRLAGELFAVGNRCSHADVDLSEGEVEDCAIECWLHGSQFDLRTGVALSLPAIDPIPTFNIETVGEGDAARVMIEPTPRPASGTESQGRQS